MKSPGRWLKLVLPHIQRCWSLSPGGEARAEVQVKGQKEVGANQKVSMLIMSAITAIRRATLSGNVTNERNTKRKRRSKIISKMIVIVTYKTIELL